MNSISFNIKLFAWFTMLTTVSAAKASTCDEGLVNKYISQVSYMPAKTLCGSELNMLHIRLKQGFDKGESKLNVVSLNIKDSDNVSVTKYPLKYSKSNNGTVIFVCVNKDYLDNSLITFSIVQKSVTKTLKSTASQNKLSIKNSNQICSLKSVIKNT